MRGTSLGLVRYVPALAIECSHGNDISAAEVD